MSMHAGGPWMAYRSFTSDSSVKQIKLADGTLRRVVSYARPFRTGIALYLAVLIVSSLLVVAQPLLFRRIVDHAIPERNTSAVLYISLAIAGLAIF